MSDPVEPPSDAPPPDDLGYDAWVLLANGAYWDHTDPNGTAEWNAARDRWRDHWHATLTPEPATGPPFDSHVRIVTTVLPRIGSRWTHPDIGHVTVISVAGGVKYSLRGGCGSAALSYFLARFQPFTESSDVE